jgi:hypothetical protein
MDVLELVSFQLKSGLKPEEIGVVQGSFLSDSKSKRANCRTESTHIQKLKRLRY